MTDLATVPQPGDPHARPGNHPKENTVITVYISIGNSDDKLTQNEWAAYVTDVREALRNLAYRQHGEWFSVGDSPWQNACWCVEVRPVMVEDLKARLGSIASRFKQDSIAWAVAPTTQFLGGDL